MLTNRQAGIVVTLLGELNDSEMSRLFSANQISACDLFGFLRPYLRRIRQSVVTSVAVMIDSSG